jgi:acyl-CoA reductase-like NAD-dependent aldehyde dehydrogenase
METKIEYATETSMNFESRNPATGELLGVHREHDKAETDARLQRAWDGWRHWSRSPLRERIAFPTRLATYFQQLKIGTVTAIMEHCDRCIGRKV